MKLENINFNELIGSEIIVVKSPIIQPPSHHTPITSLNQVKTVFYF